MDIQTIGIVGYGSFGAFIHMLAKKLAPHVTVRIYSHSHVVDAETFFSLEATCQSDLLFICTPIHSFEETIQECAPLLSSTTIVCDVATVKVHTLSVLKKYAVPNYIATHPMFGPYSYEKHHNSLHDLRLAWCASSLSTTEQQRCIEELEKIGLRVLTLSAEEHDTLVAETLFLTHLVGQIVHQGGFERTSIDTVSFGFLMDAVESVRNDEKLFRDVFVYNPYCKKVLEQFTDAQRQVLEKLAQ